MADLEHALRELSVEWPPTPDIAGAVRRVIAEEATRPEATRRRRRPSWAWRPALAYAAAVLVIALGGTMAVSDSARSAILEFLGLKGAEIERREPDAPPPPRGGRAPLGADLGLGRRVTLEQARAIAGFEAVAPQDSALGDPGAIYVDAHGIGVSFVYPARPGFPESAQSGAGLLVTEVMGRVTPYIEKSVGMGTTVNRLMVGGERAYFLSGAPHGFAYGTGDTDVRFEDQRLAGNTLLVEHGDLLVRIEGEISQSRAVELARSITATFENRSG